MKRLLLVWLVATASSLWAGPCAVGLLSGYIGSTCTSGGASFDLWSYDPGLTGVPAAAVMVIPSVAGGVFEFLQMGPGWLQGIGATTSGSIGFRGTGDIVGARLYLGSGGFLGDTGGVFLTTDICLGSTIPGCGSGTTLTPISSYNLAGSPPVILSEAVFPLATSAHIVTTFTITGGNGGAGLSVFESGLYTVPEPGSWLTAGTAGLALLLAARRRMRRS